MLRRAHRAGALQVLTHMREKLQFVTRRNRILAREGAQLDSGLGAKRDSLNRLRQRRDSLRQMATKIKETSVYIDNPLLLADMQARSLPSPCLRPRLDVPSPHRRTLKMSS